MWLLQHDFKKVEAEDLNFITYQYKLKNILNNDLVITFETKIFNSNIFEFNLELNRVDNNENYHVFKIQEQINVLNFKLVKISTNDFVLNMFEKLYVNMLNQNPTYIDGFPISIMNLFE
jgi:hypothetical protein